MHECPECGSACDCDGEDTWLDEWFSCIHDCEYLDDHDYIDDPDGGYGGWLDGDNEWGWCAEIAKPTLWQKIKSFDICAELKNHYPIIQIGWIVLAWDRDDWRKTIHIEWTWNFYD